MKEGTECDAVVSVTEAVNQLQSALFGDVYITSVQKAKSNRDICETEVSFYKKEPSKNAIENTSLHLFFKKNWLNSIALCSSVPVLAATS